MERVEKVTIDLPEQAFHCNPRKVKISVGDYMDKVYSLILDTKANYIYQSPTHRPRTVHISTLNCSHPQFKLQDIVTIRADVHEKVQEISLRKPFEVS
jgi:hypothetical protein